MSMRVLFVLLFARTYRYLAAFSIEFTVHSLCTWSVRLQRRFYLIFIANLSIEGIHTARKHTHTRQARSTFQRQERSRAHKTCTEINERSSSRSIGRHGRAQPKRSTLVFFIPQPVAVVGWVSCGGCWTDIRRTLHTAYGDIERVRRTIEKGNKLPDI